MTTEKRLNFIKAIPAGFMANAGHELRDNTFMSVNFDSLFASIGQHPVFQGKGVLMIWFWDTATSVKKAVRIDFSKPLIAQTPVDEWLDVSITGQESMPSNVGLAIEQSAPGDLQLESFRIYSIIASELLSNNSDLLSYKHFLGEHPEIQILKVEHNFVNRMVMGFKGGQSLIIERDDQPGTFNIFINDQARLVRITEEMENPDWGKVEMTEVLI
jgi:hypothetical protein